MSRPVADSAADALMARLVSFDGTEQTSGALLRPEHYRELFAMTGSGKPIIARGAGLSYSAASMADGGVSVDMTRFDRILAFDATTGLVRVESGVRIGELSAFLARKGRHLPVLPGYPDITVGGCVAFDVHGKSQFHSGNFGEWVVSFELFHVDHGPLLCSRHENPEAFELTLGGLGLTGIITEIALRTDALPGASVEVEPVAVGNLVEAVELMQSRAGDVDCFYSWHNLNSERRFGSGVVYIERFANGEVENARARRLVAIRARSPMPVWNRLTTPLAMSVYEFREKRARTTQKGFGRAFFPIEGLEYYYAAFGRRGLREYQMIIPFAEWSGLVVNLQRLIKKFAVSVTLASLKLFKGPRRRLAFSHTGVCLTIDVPACPNALALFAALDELALELQAPLNLSKDSRIDAKLCRGVFPGYDDFKSDLRKFDPNRRYQSRLSERIGV
jgi:decaprenylphospho-beta-D-ribofuranose 2-oxidase